VCSQLKKHLEERAKQTMSQAKLKERERVLMLKEHREEDYIRMLKEAKNERLLGLLRQTDDYMAKIGEFNRSLAIVRRQPQAPNSPFTLQERL
jgi:SWI/SNF-related matrix-associated actin-dependent regulator of chromatin subfamily A protein 2/4